MSRVPAVCGVVVLLATLPACTPGEALRTPPATRPSVDLPAAEPALQVGIAVDVAEASVTASSPFEIRSADRVLARSPAMERWRFRDAGDGRVEGFGPAGQRTGVSAVPLHVVPVAGATVWIGEREYRGAALVRSSPRGVSAVNTVALETYLRGVVPREMGRRPATELEALKAQAVAARTYAVGNIGGRAALGFDVYATVLDQVYGGVADEDTVANRAVDETRGEILSHAGRPIQAYYSSTCGGSTASLEESWPWRAPQPYLRGVSDRVPGSDRYYCESSNRFRWETRWARADLLAVLAQTLRAHTAGAVGSARVVNDVVLVSAGPSGRATVRLAVDGRAYALRADSVRWVLRPQPGPAILNSSRLTAVESAERDGVLTELVIRGQGWGHAIGMCQVGAMGRARAGQPYHEILRAYYTGVEITRLY